jgi:hypothetical protein
MSELKTARIPLNSVNLKLVGDLILGQIDNRDLYPLFKKYELLLENIANRKLEERLILYQFMVGLTLTGHARRSEDVETKKKIFDIKNQVFLYLANNPDLRKKLFFRYLISKNFRVTEFCPACAKSNTEGNLPRHQWKFCKECQIDRKFFNVLAMNYRFSGGSGLLFLSHDLIGEVKNLPLLKRDKIENYKEELLWDKYKYTTKSLSVFNLDAVVAIQKSLLKKKI